MLGAHQQAAERGKKENPKGKAKAKSAAKAPAKQGDHLTLELPQSVKRGAPVTVRIAHTLHDDLGPQKLHVTLKQGDNTRVERKVIEVKGTGTAEVTFDVPADLPGAAVILAAFAGEDITTALQHLNSKPIPLSDP